MQSVLFRNWTRIAVSISCDDNHYTTGTSRDDCRLKFHVPHQIARHVSFDGSKGRQLIYKDDDRHDMQKSKS